MSKGEDVILFNVIFSILVLAFGQGTGISSVTLQLQAPTLAPSPKGQIQQCQNTDAGCISQNIGLATAYVGWAIVNLPILIIFFTSLIFGFGVQIISIVFSPQTSIAGVPFLGFFWVALNLYSLWEVLRLVRGTSVGV